MLAFSAPAHLGPKSAPCGSTAPHVLFRRAPERCPRGVVRAQASQSYDVVVVGAGVCGLCTAHALATKHQDSVSSLLVTEARDRVGGNITTVSNDEGYLWEEGPNSFTPNDSIFEIAVDVGIEKEFVFGDSTEPRFVYWDGKLRATPSGPDVLTFDLLSILGKIRAGLGAIGIKESMPDYEESVEQFIRRNLGAEVFERLIEPFCSGVYAGNPANLGMKAAFQKIHVLEQNGGSLVGGAIKLMQDRKKNPPPPRDPRLPPKPPGQTVASFRKGLQTLPDGIAKNMKESIKLNWKLEKIEKQSDGSFELSYTTPEGAEVIRAKCLTLTAPAYVVADLLEKNCGEAAEALRKIDYPPVAAVTVSYPMSAIREDRLNGEGDLPGFGQLHPRSQGITTLGTIYSSRLFPNRCPKGEMLFLNYIGGATNRGILDQTDDQLVDQVHSDLQKMVVKPGSALPRVCGVRVWPRAIPQFNVGHLDLLETANNSLESSGWRSVKLGGNYATGVALGKCVEFSVEFANEIAVHVDSLASDKKTVASTSS